MKFNEFIRDSRLSELVPTIAGTTQPGATGQAPAPGQPQAGQAPAQDPQAAAKTQAMAVLQAKERRDNIQKQLKGIDDQMKSLVQQKADLQKELATIK